MSASIGALRARVFLFSPQAENGVTTWRDEGSAFAAVTPVGGRIDVPFDGTPSASAYRLEIRAPSAIAAGWRLAWCARRLRVLAVRDIGNARLALDCAEEAA
jgi:head-tail adaptor